VFKLLNYHYVQVRLKIQNKNKDDLKFKKQNKHLLNMLRGMYIVYLQRYCQNMVLFTGPSNNAQCHKRLDTNIRIPVIILYRVTHLPPIFAYQLHCYQG